MKRKFKTLLNHYSVAIIAAILLITSFTLSATLETTLAF